MPKSMGRRLNEEWKIGAAQSFFSTRGTWFQRLEQFPGALCDPHGYVLFENEASYLHCDHVNVGKKTNVHKGISQLAGYIRVR
jgi:hypothetical protein